MTELAQVPQSATTTKAANSSTHTAQKDTETSTEAIDRRSVQASQNERSSAKNLQNDLNDLNSVRKQPTSSKNETEIRGNSQDQVQIHEISAKEAMKLSNGRKIYKIQAPESLALCDSFGRDYDVHQNGLVNVAIASGYKMTLFVKDKSTNQLLLDSNKRPQTVVIVNTPTSPKEQKFTITTNQAKEELHVSNVLGNIADNVVTTVQNNKEQEQQTSQNSNTNQVRQETSTNEANKSLVDQRTVTTEQDAAIITKKSNNYDSYGRVFSTYDVKLPEDVKIATVSSNGYLTIQNSNSVSIYQGYAKTFYLVDKTGSILKDSNGNLCSIRVVNNPGTPNQQVVSLDKFLSRKNITTKQDANSQPEQKKQEASNEPVQDTKKDLVVLGNGLVTLKESVESQEKTVVRRVQYGYYYYPQQVKVKTDVKVNDAKITLSEGTSVYFPASEKNLQVTTDGSNVNFRAQKTVVFATIKDNKIDAIYRLDPSKKSLDDITQNPEGKSVLNEYLGRQLPLNATSETVLNAGEHISLERNPNNDITKISINAPLFTEALEFKNGTFVNSENHVVSNVKLSANGTLSYVTKFTLNGKNITVNHNIDKNGTHTEKEQKANIYTAKAQVQEYTEFSNTNAQEAQHIEKVTRTQRNISDRVLLDDAKKTLELAIKNDTVPVFFASYHGARNYNTGTGRDSKWISIIAKAAKEMNYEGPVGIQMMHCHSGVSQLEMNALKALPAGSYLIKSQDNNYSYYNNRTSQSADGNTLQEALHPTATNCAAYFAAVAISAQNNPTVAVINKNGSVDIFSENGTYPGSKPNSTLPNINKEETIEVLNASGVSSQTANSYYNNSQSHFILRVLKHASNQSDYSFESAI